MLHGNSLKFLIVFFVLGLACLFIPLSASSDEGTAIFDACSHQTAYHRKAGCYQKKIEALMKKQGTEQALDALSLLAGEDPDILQRAHQYAYFLGWRSFFHYEDASVAFSHCRDTFSSGCYHGVLQGHLGSLSKVDALTAAAVCDEQIEAARHSMFLRYQCVHGLGHGLTVHFQYDLKKALSVCDGLAMEWDRDSCYGGVFMENVVASQNIHHQQQYSGQAAKRKSVLRPRDPLYPCNSVATKYQHACYQMQASAILTLTQHNFSQAFHICSKAPAAFTSTCYESLGRNLSGLTLRNEQKIVSLCGKGQPTATAWCLIGAVKDIITAHADPQRGLAFCRHLNVPTQKEGCYAAAGQVLATLYPDEQRRERACAVAEEQYVSVCRSAAPKL
jgi:hypothetical protein